MRDAADSWDINLPLNWHSNCDIAHEVDCDEETKDSGAREELHGNCDSVSAGTAMRRMSIACRIWRWRVVENSQESEGLKVLSPKKTIRLQTAFILYSIARSWCNPDLIDP